MNKGVPKLSRENVEAIYPLRPVQQGMLFHELSSPGASPYFRQMCFRLSGKIDPTLCEATWNRLMARHCLLRSVFDYETAAQPIQIVLKHQDVEFGYLDVAGPDATARVLAWREADAKRGFHLRRERLMRVQLFRLADDRFEMVWSHPHILLDGWSGSILLGEFARLYAAARQGRILDLPPPPHPGEYLAALARRDPAASLDYWAALLAGYDEPATLPRDRSRPASSPAARSAWHSFQLEPGQADALAALAKSQGVTAGTLFQALWGLVLGGWTDRQDVVFGTVVSGRSVATAGVEELVGLFINTLPVRVRFEKEQSFAALLQDVQQQAIAALAHDHVALADIQARSELRPGLLDHLLVFENYPEAEAGDAETGFVVTGTESEEQANYDFGLMVHMGSACTISLPYDQTVFTAGRMGQVESHLRRLIGQVLADPSRSLQSLDMLAEAERTRVEGFAEGPRTAWPEEASLADLWHRQVARTPDRVAVVAGGERLDYRALDRLAEGVARRLRQEGLQAEEIVGVLAERGYGRIAALLGILEAGGVYLPLSAAFPDDRLRFILEDTGCRKVLADPMGAGHLSALAPGLARPLAGEPAEGPEQGERIAVSGTSLAYVIYTSGSTGRPKGVALAHSGFVNMIQAQIAGFGVCPNDAVLQFASCSFDASLSEIFMALLAGARLIIAPEAAVRDGTRLLALMAAEKVTVATLPPSYLRALDGADLGSLRVLITAGEPPDGRDARHYARRLRYFNAYGPTEASVCASWHEVAAEAPYAEGIPIGRPVANTRMAVLDRWGRAVPVGALGEICLAGPGLARHYLGRPELTAERFVDIGGRRHYRTGDAGRWQEDGTLLYLGRRDEQVKLDGHRIEPGEIESLLRAHADVAQAAVLVRGEPRRLVAYVVLRRPVEPEALRRHLAKSLPAWMVPAAIVMLDALPRTVAGKVDRRALPDPAAPASADDTPLTAIEAVVAETFAQVLGRGPYGRRASFAASGGGSLQAIQLLARLRRGGLVLDLPAVLAADTVAAMAALADSTKEDVGGAAEAESAGASLPLTPIQHWFLRTHTQGLSQLNHLVLLEAGRPLATAAVAAAVAAVWRHHDALRLRFSKGDGQWVATIVPPEPAPPLRDIDLRQAGDPWAALEIDALSLQTGFDLAAGPLFKATRYRLPEGDCLFLLAHHLVVDAVSWGFILEDLFLALRQTDADNAMSLPSKTTSYARWAERLAEWSLSPALEAERPYWNDVAAVPIPPLPTDHPVRPHGYAETDTVAADLGERAAGLSDARIVAGLLAALAVALHGWDGRERGRVLLATHGRHSPFPGVDPSRTVGWFTADHPFLLDCPGGGPAAVAAIAARLAGVPSKGLGWGVLRWLAPRPIEAPEDEISLNYVGRMEPDLDGDFRFSERLPSATTGAMERRRLLELEAGVSKGCLHVALRYAPSIHGRATVKRVLDALVEAFRAADDG
ncbi:amino acid adenylation domain-containing protein [Shumkonia mesophila]|uniref:amino acid adenylation domain-containing protein n=1 Tax=Shumkonia mesophila TaxID=2838854 RepID=UPI0029347FC8|nr:amino acid adenylation domain-containing protein [Shumkonia mesophila]